MLLNAPDGLSYHRTDSTYSYRDGEPGVPG